MRKGRPAETSGGIVVGGGLSMPKPGIGSENNVDAGDSDDMIAVYNASLGTDTAPIWRDRMSNGLDRPEIKLIS